jgi:hypothetical protein
LNEDFGVDAYIYQQDSGVYSLDTPRIKG